MKERFDLLVFDWDGTLVDSIGWIVHCIRWAAVTCRIAPPSEEACRSVIGLGLGEAMDTLFPGSERVLQEQLVRGYRERYRSRRMSRNDFFQGVYEMLWRLRHSGYLLAVATGKSRAGLQAAMRATESEALFMSTRCADETASKPDPEMLLQVMDELRVRPGRALMVGDTVHDLQMASNAGVASVAVSCGADDPQRLLRCEPVACLQRTAELEVMLG